MFAEDEEAVRHAACEFLSLCGYNTLEARDGMDAIRVASSYQGPIHLLVTDVVMPHFSGSQVAQQLAPGRPEMRVLYGSGYASPTLLRHGVHAGQTMFLQKPFTLKMLAWKIRQELTVSTAPQPHAVETSQSNLSGDQRTRTSLPARR